MYKIMSRTYTISPTYFGKFSLHGISKYGNCKFMSRCIKLFRWIIWTVGNITVNCWNIVSTRQFIYSNFCWQTHRAHPATDLLVCARKYQSVQLHRTTCGTEGCPFRFSVGLIKKTRWFAAQKPVGFSRWREVSSLRDNGDIGKKRSNASNVRIGVMGCVLATILVVQKQHILWVCVCSPSYSAGNAHAPYYTGWHKKGKFWNSFWASSKLSLFL
jgi:hypothetical protein